MKILTLLKKIFINFLEFKDLFNPASNIKSNHQLGKCSTVNEHNAFSKLIGSFNG